MTAGMVGVGALLWLRHRLSGRGGELSAVSGAEAKRAGRAVLVVCAVIALLVLGIVALQWRRGGQLGLLSLTMPVIGLLWLLKVGLQSLRHTDAGAPLLGQDRPSRRPSKLEALPSASQRPSQPPTDRRVSA